MNATAPHAPKPGAPPIEAPDPAVPLAALRDLIEDDPHVTLARAIQRVEWAIRHGAFVALPVLVMRPDYDSAVAAEMRRMIEAMIGPVALGPPPQAPAAPSAELPPEEGPAASAPSDPAPSDPAPSHPVPAPQPDSAGDDRDDDDDPQVRAVAAHVAALKRTALFDASADVDLVQWTLDGVPPTEICDQLDCGMQDIKTRWMQLQVPGVTVRAGKRDTGGCMLLLDALKRRAEMADAGR